MYYITKLESAIFETPYQEGYRKLKVLSGYASSAFLTHILSNYPDLSLELIIGMACKDGITEWDHKRYRQIVSNNPQVDIKYQRSLPAVHSKIYHWYQNDEFDTNEAFIGSSNFSWAGFRDQMELMGKVDYPNLPEVFRCTDTVSCLHENVEDEIRINQLEVEKRDDGSIGLYSVEGNKIELGELDFVKLSLLTKSGEEIHERGGLNWGQREGREPNQAYIPVPVSINRDKENFFPPFKHTFTLLTDDGEQMSCIMAQDNRKAIQTTDSNSILGRYFRQRLNIPLGSKVNMTDLEKYGRTHVTIYKLNNETYFMDFGVPV
ncbi:restriction endonuclease PLD domain-containing protein [Virgibacillus sp. MG-45]|uniref:restriction endonuclease PLD domain-containing protein n=1 Tax=Virgibacillus sp. MG-45 TaxID=3102791 RepID=UPI002EDAF61B